MKTKSVAAETKQLLVGSFQIKAKDSAKRTFRGALSTSHLDLGDFWKRDIVWPGAFKATMEAFKAAPDPYIPLLDVHDGSSILNVFGHMLEGEEVLTGKVLEYELARDGKTLKVPEMIFETEWQVIDGPDGDRVLDRLRPGSVRKMSMGYRAMKSDDVELAVGPARNLRDVDLMEGSLVVFAMQPNALVDTSSVKTVRLLEKNPDELSEEERKDLRRLATRIGSLLRPKSQEPPADEPAAPAPVDPPAPPAPPAAEPVPPEATPEEADSQTADVEEEKRYLYAEALQQRLLRLKVSRTHNQTLGG